MKLSNLMVASVWIKKLHADINVHSNAYFYNVAPDTAGVSKTILSRSAHGNQIICTAEIGQQYGLHISTPDNAPAAHFLGAVCAVNTLIDYTLAHALLEHAEQTHCWIRMQDEPHTVVPPVHTVNSITRHGVTVTARDNLVRYPAGLRLHHAQIDYDLVAAYTIWQWLCRHPDAQVKQQLPLLLTAATLTGV